MLTDKVLAIVAGSAALVLAVTAGWLAWDRHSMRADHATAVLGYEKRIGDAQEVATQALVRKGLLEDKLKTEAANNATRLEDERKATAGARAALAGLHADNGRMRNIIAAFAAGGGSTADSSAEAFRERAESLGRLLGTALQVSAECAVDAEGLGADTRALLRDNDSIRAAVNGASSYKP